MKSAWWEKKQAPGGGEDHLLDQNKEITRAAKMTEAKRPS